MDYDSNDDEDVTDLCKLLGIKIPPTKKIEKVTNKENFDINNLPVVIVPDHANVSGEVSRQDLSECHVMMVEATVHSPMLPTNIEPADIYHGQISVVEPIIIEETNDLALSNASPLLVNHEVEHGDLRSGRKRCSKGCSKNKNWTKNNSKKLRMEGKEYLGYRRNGKGPKFSVLHDTIRPARMIGPPCTSEFCKKSKLRACDTIQDKERNTLFSIYWNNMTWDQRKQYVV